MLKQTPRAPPQAKIGNVPKEQWEISPPNSRVRVSVSIFRT